jgi:sialidase-1
MIRAFAFSILSLIVASRGLGQVMPMETPSEVANYEVVFEEGKDGYAKTRIPALVSTNSGVLLAFAEGRTAGDSGPIDLVLKRSLDQGRTWGPLQIVWDDGENTCGNPAPVVDRDTGVVWLLMTWNKGTDSEREIMAGNSDDVRHVYVASSADEGVTWTTPRKISESTRRSHWRWYATGPGNGIQLKVGAKKGRLLIPCNHSDHSHGNHPYRSHVIYSDDHGVTWQLGGVHEDRTNESAVAELSDGRVLQQMRSYHDKGIRAMADSIDGGDSWDKVYLDSALITPVCQASMISNTGFKNEGTAGEKWLLFASPFGKGRERMTLWLSLDDGKTWKHQKQLHEGGSAYGNLVQLADDRIGLLFEKDNYRTISFTTFSLEWLKGNKDGSTP